MPSSESSELHLLFQHQAQQRETLPTPGCISDMNTLQTIHPFRSTSSSSKLPKTTIYHHVSPLRGRNGAKAGPANSTRGRWTKTCSVAATMFVSILLQSPAVVVVALHLVMVSSWHRVHVAPSNKAIVHSAKAMVTWIIIHTFTLCGGTGYQGEVRPCDGERNHIAWVRGAKHRSSTRRGTRPQGQVGHRGGGKRIMQSSIDST